VFHLTFPKEWKHTDISQLFSPFGKYEIISGEKMNEMNLTSPENKNIIYIKRYNESLSLFVGNRRWICFMVI